MSTTNTALQYDPITNEPFIRVPHRHANLIVTPPRPSDYIPLIDIMNDPTVYSYLYAPSHPFLESDAIEWIQSSKQECDKVLSNYSKGELLNPEIPIDGSPVNTIREILADGTQKFVGEISLKRSRCLVHLHQPDIMKQKLQENNDRSLGDPDILHDVSLYLAPSHHGRGIASTVLRTLTACWYLPRMKIRNVEAGIFYGNIGSVKLFEKHGYILETFIKVVSEHFRMKSGVKPESVGVYYWRRNRQRGVAVEVKELKV